MLISFNWLKKYVNLPDSVSAEEVAEKLKLATVEVEKIEYLGKNLENIVVGKILQVEQHPNADRLKVCKVDVGSEVLNIVCGGSNVADGLKVVVAKLGAKVLWHGEGEPVVMEKTAIRGVESLGMICGADEVGIIEQFPKKSEKEIVDLSGIEAKPGTSLSEALMLNDVILEIDNKSLSNRPDLLGHYGLAREVAVLYNRDVKALEVFEIKPDKSTKLEVKIEGEKNVARYMAVVLENIQVAPSPDWLKSKLTAVGLKSINNMVDVTNYVMLDLGQPLHAFDASELGGGAKKEIVVRLAADSEKLVMLDGVERALDPSVLVIAGKEKPLAVAGIMGGVESGIKNTTTSIVIESANFDAAVIRKAGAKLNLRTDASMRFEKSLDPNLCAVALQAAVQMILSLCPEAKVTSKIVDQYKAVLKSRVLTLSPGLFEQKIGAEIDVKTSIKILERLGFGVAEKKKNLEITIPTWRATKDIEISEDIVEEVLRFVGYKNIPGTLPNFTLAPPMSNSLLTLKRKILGVLVRELGYNEVYNYSFLSPNFIEKMGDKTEKYIELSNPLAQDRPFLRRSVVGSLLESIVKNSDRFSTLQLLEIGQVYLPEAAGVRSETNGDELLPAQPTVLGLAFSQKKNDEPWTEVRRGLERLSKEINITFSLQDLEQKQPWHHPTRSARVMAQEQMMGEMYELHPQVQNALKIENRVGVLELDLTRLAELPLVSGSDYHPVSLYPSVERDLAFMVKNEVTHEALLRAMKIDPLLEKAELFDVYKGEHVRAGYKSMAYRLIFTHADRTLTSAEVDTVLSKIIDVLKQYFAIEVRV